MVKNIGVNDGHTISGPGCGAVGIINESEHTRKVGNALRNYLKANGVNAINCTVDYASTTSESLSLVVQQANRQDLDWFISIHFNAGGGKGVEVYTYGGRQYQDAIDVCNNISKLGFINRGVKAGSGLYVIRKTSAKSMLIEVCFVDTDDANKYLEVGHEAIAKAIAEALIGHVNEAIKEEEKKENSSVSAVKPQVESYLDKAAKFVGSRCKELQEKLIKCGYSCGSYGADGVFGQATYDALIKFQRNNGLDADGLAGVKTFAKLDQLIAKQTSSQGDAWIKKLQQECNVQGFSNQKVDGFAGPNTLNACPTLRKGASGNITKLLQEKLVSLGYSTNGVDGIFGKGTYDAVVKYQKAKGLSADGIVGKGT